MPHGDIIYSELINPFSVFDILTQLDFHPYSCIVVRSLIWAQKKATHNKK